jgi:hypothetical protein
VKEVSMTPLLVATVDGTSAEELGQMLDRRGLRVKTVLARARAAEVGQWLHRLIPSVILGSDYEEKVADDLKASAFIPIAHPSMVTMALGVTDRYEYVAGLIPRFLGNREEIAQRFIAMCERSAPPGAPVQLGHVEASFAQIESHFAR